MNELQWTYCRKDSFKGYGQFFTPGNTPEPRYLLLMGIVQQSLTGLCDIKQHIYFFLLPYITQTKEWPDKHACENRGVTCVCEQEIWKIQLKLHMYA